MASESDEQFVERQRLALDPDSTGYEPWGRLVALARRGAGLTLDRQRLVVREDHSKWIRETYSRYVPLPLPAGETSDE